MSMPSKVVPLRLRHRHKQVHATPQSTTTTTTTTAGRQCSQYKSHTNRPSQPYQRTARTPSHPQICFDRPTVRPRNRSICGLASSASKTQPLTRIPTRTRTRTRTAQSPPHPQSPTPSCNAMPSRNSTRRSTSRIWTRAPTTRAGDRCWGGSARRICLL